MLLGVQEQVVEDVEETEDEEDEDQEEEDEVAKPKQVKKASTQLTELENQVIRLRDDGLFRVELLYQLQQINDFFKTLTSD